MQIAPVSFAGKKEIQKFVKDAGKLTWEEKSLANIAIGFHELEIDRTSDGDYLQNPKEAETTSKAVVDFLHKAGASKFSYLIAVDLLNAPIVQAGISPVSKRELVDEALKIAGKADDVSKKDIIDNVPKFNIWH